MKLLLPKKFLAALVVFLFSIHLNAITYYISTSGDDNAAGTSIGTAWKSIAKLNTVNLAPGTLVLFEGGQTFLGSISLNSNDANDSNNSVHISSYGNGKAIIKSGASMGFYAYNTKGIKISRLIFEGSGLQTNSTEGIMFYTDLGGNVKLGNIHISNTEIRQYGKTGLSVYSYNYNTGYKDVLIDSVHVHHVKENGILIGGYTSQTHTGYAHQNVIIRKTEADNIPGYADANVHRGSGIIMAQVDNGTIEYSSAHHNGAANTHCGGPGGIWTYDANNITIQYCEAYSNSSGSGCDGLGFDLDGGITNSTLQYNYSHNNDGAGYLLGQYDNARPWKNNIVRYNISENDGRTNAGGITLFKGANSAMYGCKIYNNTIFTSPSASNPGVAAFSVIEWFTGIEGIEVYNNIFQTTGGVALVNVPTGYNAYFAGNLYWSTGAAFKIKYQGTTYADLSSWRTATGNEKVGSLNTGITADPFLSNAGSGGIIFPSPCYSMNAYKINNGSPALNAGLDLNNLFTINIGANDFYKNPLSTSLKDIGAHEKPEIITTSVQDQSGAGIMDISFFPNPIPAGEFLQIRGGEMPYSIEMFNISGALILKEDQVGETCNWISSLTLAGGIYIIRISDSKGRKHTGKLVIP